MEAQYHAASCLIRRRNRSDVGVAVKEERLIKIYLKKILPITHLIFKDDNDEETGKFQSTTRKRPDMGNARCLALRYQ